VADQVLAHGKADLRFERVERLDLEAEQFVETEFVLEDFAQGGFEAGLLFGGAAGRACFGSWWRGFSIKNGRRG
jgi:hypothetical protein